MVNSEEFWRDVAGYEGYYQVSSKGRVKSLARPVKRGPIIGTLKEKIRIASWAGDKSKYLQVVLSKGGVKENKKIHHLVLEAFVGPKPFDDAVARHLDDDPTNNCVENLAWGSVSENTLDKFLNGYVHHARALTNAQIDDILKDSRSQRKIAEDYGVSQTIVWRVKNKGENPYITVSSD